MRAARGLFAVFGFDATHQALQAENVLLAAAVEVALIPTPRALGSSCGFAVRVPVAERDAAVAAMVAGRIEPNAEIEIEDRVGS